MTMSLVIYSLPLPSIVKIVTSRKVLWVGRESLMGQTKRTEVCKERPQFTAV
jgi:hypothetical protein